MQTKDFIFLILGCTFTLSGNNLRHAKVTITDLTGKVIMADRLNQQQQITLPEKAVKGIYFVQIETGEGFAVRRIIKE